MSLNYVNIINQLNILRKGFYDEKFLMMNQIIMR